MDGSDSDASDEFSPQSFRVVRHCPNNRRAHTDQEGAAAVRLPTMAALSPDPPSSPMVEDAQSQPQPGTDQEGAEAVGAPMAMETPSLDPPPRSESDAIWRRQPTGRPAALTAPYTVESIFDNHSKRRGALIRALTEGSKRARISLLTDFCAYICFLDYVFLAS